MMAKVISVQNKWCRPESKWIAIYPDLTLEHFRKPAKNADVLLWVRRYKARHDPGFRHRYKYKLYAADMKPGFVRHGTFPSLRFTIAKEPRSKTGNTDPGFISWTATRS